MHYVNVHVLRRSVGELSPFCPQVSLYAKPMEGSDSSVCEYFNAVDHDMWEEELSERERAVSWRER